ncbi:MAG TPA: DUF3299 domain-containing protein [bacterium]|nr:DUF3299 domain-containing protein [bacterium]
MGHTERGPKKETGIDSPRSQIWIRFLLALTALSLLPIIPLHPAGSDSAAATQSTVPASDPASNEFKGSAVTVYSLLENHPFVPWTTLAHFPCPTPDIDDLGKSHSASGSKKEKYPIPNFIRSLDGAKVAVVGFMMPLALNDAGDKTTSFILARSQATCCYGITLRMNEWMYVEMVKGKSAEAMMDTPITVFGTISVGSQIKESSWTLYRMMADKVTVPKIDW